MFIFFDIKIENHCFNNEKKRKKGKIIDINVQRKKDMKKTNSL